MSCAFTTAELEAYLLDRSESGSELEAHLASCPRCRDELDWLRLERQPFESRAPEPRDDVGALWDGIAERIAAEAAGPAPARPATLRLRAAWFGSGFAAAATAAAVFLLYVQAPTVTHPRLAPSYHADAAVAVTPPAPVDAKDPLVATDRAADEYTNAIAALEAEYRSHRNQVAPATERALAESRLLLGQARRDAGDDIDARMRVLDAYATHLRTMQEVVTEIGQR